MKNTFNSQVAFSALFAMGFLVSGCESNSVNGYFASIPNSTTGTTQGTSNPISAPSSTPTMIPTSKPEPTITPTSTVTPKPTVTPTQTMPPAPIGTPTQAPTPTPTPTVTIAPAPSVTPVETSSPTPVALPSTFVPNGILNGHFDVDTATTSMPFPTNRGTVTYHVHEYDKINHTTTVDFFNLLNDTDINGRDEGYPVVGNAFDQIQKTIPQTKRFYLVVVNSVLNPGGVLQLNSSVLRVTDYQNLTQRLLASGVRPAAYTIGTPTSTGDTQLKSLKIAFDSNVTADELLVPTGPLACVFPDIAGKLGEYRDGALVVQAIDASTIELNASTGSATSNGGLLWEGIIYNHYMTMDQDGREIDPEICY